MSKCAAIWPSGAVKIVASGLAAKISVGATALDYPWAVQLTTGQQCLAAQGAHDQYHGQPIDYGCSRSGSALALELLRGVDHHGRLWSYQSVYRSNGSSCTPGPTVYVRTAWFAGPPPPTTPPPCTGSELAVSAGQAGAGLGHEGLPILFRNISPTACSLYGYPGVAGLNSSGQQVIHATRTSSGYLGGLANAQPTPPTVDLSPGQTASALVEGTDNPVGTATSCPSYPTFLVTPPNTTNSVRVPATSASLPTQCQAAHASSSIHRWVCLRSKLPRQAENPCVQGQRGPLPPAFTKFGRG
jgi:Protein of unknown function (DUF4232)